jgi:hypothetical protein
LNRTTGKSRAEVGTDIPELRGRTRDETDGRIEIAPNPFVRHCNIQEVVGVVDLEPVGGRIAAEVLAAGGQSPHADEKILVATKM